MLLTYALPAQAAGASPVTAPVAAWVPQDGSGTGVVSLTLVSSQGVAGAATNNVTVHVRQLRAGVVLGDIGAVTFDQNTSLVAEVPLSVPVNPVTLAALDVIDVELVQNGTGLAVPSGVVLVVGIG